MKPEELADSLEEVFAYDGLATDSPQAIWLADNYKAILSALRRIEKLEAALGEIENYVLTVAYPSPSTVAQTARQALTGEA